MAVLWSVILVVVVVVQGTSYGQPMAGGAPPGGGKAFARPNRSEPGVPGRRTDTSMGGFPS